MHGLRVSETGRPPTRFVNACLLQLQAAARSPFGTISETHINAALAMIEAAAPKDEIEAALAVQMACTHTAAMAVLAKLEGAFTSEQRVVAFGSAAARLMRAYATIHFDDGPPTLTGSVGRSKGR